MTSAPDAPNASSKRDSAGPAGESATLKRALYLMASMPPHRLALKGGAKLARKVSHLAQEASLSVGGSELSDATLRGKLVAHAQSPSTLARRPRWICETGDAYFFQALTERFGGLSQRDQDEADVALAGRIRLPGGVFGEFGAPPAWLRDPVSGYEWPLRYFKRLEHGRAGADVLNIWWPGSFYHLIPLGKAYRHAQRRGDAAAANSYATAFVQHVESFRAQNRYGFGQHWGSTTIVALRLMHLVFAHALFHDSEALSEGFHLALYKDIYRHAVHVHSNLEWFPVRTNHYLTNLFALYVIATLYPEFREADNWRRFARGELVGEVEHHFQADGVLHEGSVNYHRFVLEIFLTTMAFAARHGDTEVAAIAPRVGLALDFLAACRRPDGTLPRVGDAADIRLLHLEGRDVFADADHLFNLGAVLLERADLKACAPQFGEHAYWMLGERGVDVFTRLSSAQAPRPEARAFPHGGFALHAQSTPSGEAWLMFRAGPLALQGVAGHGHHDQLSFELWLGGQPLLIDPGWLCYEGDPAAQREFRTSQTHNTVVVDGRTQIANEIFAYPPPKRSMPQLECVAIANRALVIEGMHALYSDLTDPVMHRRRLHLDAERGTLLIEDSFDAGKHHDYQWNFHFAPGIAITPAGAQSVRFVTPMQSGLLSVEEAVDAASAIACGVSVAIEPVRSAWTYAHATPDVLVRFSTSATGRFTRRIVLQLDGARP